MPYAQGACLRCLMLDRRDQFIKSPRVKPIKGSTFKLQKTHPGVITIRSTKPDWATPERRPQSSSSSSLQRPRCFGSSYFRLLFFVFSSLCLGSILPAFMWVHIFLVCYSHPLLNSYCYLCRLFIAIGFADSSCFVLVHLLLRVAH